MIWNGLFKEMLNYKHNKWVTAPSRAAIGNLQA